MIYGNRVPGSGQQPSDRTIALRKAILYFVGRNPGTTSRPISKYLHEQGFTKFNMFNQMGYFLDLGDICGSRVEMGQYHYYLKEHFSEIPETVLASERRVYRHPQSEWPKFNLPVYSPIEWSVNQLQGA